MPKVISVYRVLVQTDVPELALAKDNAGHTYLALLVDHDERTGKFVCIAISRERLGEIWSGRLGLRNAFLECETGEAFSADFDSDSAASQLRLQALSAIPEEWLPSADLDLTRFLAHGETDVEAELVAQASHGRISAGVFDLDPPEAMFEPVIESHHLAAGLKLWQNLLSHAGSYVMTKLGKATQQYFMPTEDDFVFRVRAHAAGSFRIHFESKRGGYVDTAGSTAFGLALTTIDGLTRHIDDPDRALPHLQETGAHVVRAYQAMLHFVATENVPITYAWADPGSPSAKPRPIGVSGAQRTVELLTRRKDLTSTQVTFVGRFIDLSSEENDAESGTWKLVFLRPEKNRRSVRGKILEGAGDLLADIRFRKGVYRIVCEERYDATVMSKKPRRLYFLKEPPLPVEELPRLGESGTV